MSESIRWCDQHCHLPDDHAAAGQIIADANATGVMRFIDVGTDLGSSRRAIERSSQHHGVWAVAGVHPHSASEGCEGLEALLGEPGVVAVGECGLDYHYMHSPIDDQRRVFAEQIELANRMDLPLVIHTRDAWDDTLAVLNETGVPRRVVIHCFTGGPTEMFRCLDLGAVISFSGIVTFKSASDVAAAAQQCPSAAYLVETDSPYLAPVPHRGRTNTSGLLPVVGAKLAELRGIPVEAVAEQTWANAETFYGLVDGKTP